MEKRIISTEPQSVVLNGLSGFPPGRLHHSEDVPFGIGTSGEPAHTRDLCFLFVDLAAVLLDGIDSVIRSIFQPKTFS